MVAHMNISSYFSISSCAIACVAPAILAQEEQPTIQDIIKAGTALISGATDVLKEAKDNISADIAAAGIDKLTEIAKKMDEASKNIKPTEEDAPVIEAEMGKAIEAAKLFAVEVARLSNDDLLTENKLQASLDKFIKVTELDKLLEDSSSSEEDEDDSSSEEE